MGTRRQSRARVEEDEPSQSQASQSTRAAGVMDPGQDQSDRRKIRRSYRELIQQTNDQKQEYIRPESDGLFKAIARGDDLYKEVRMPREAALDSEFLQVASQLGLEQTRRLHTGFKTYEINDFVSRLRAQHQRQDGEAEVFDWMALGKRASPRFHSTPAANFMYGPMSVEPAQKKQRKKIVREKRGQLVRPEEVQDTQLDSGVETTHRVQDVLKHLTKSKSADYFRFVLDPLSFGQTVENIFHTAFLIRDGHAKLADSDDGNSIRLERTEQPTEDDYSSGKAHRKQCIVRFDWEMWEKMKAQNTTSTPIIPHRQPGDYLHPGLKNASNNNNNNNNNNNKSNDSSEDDVKPNGRGKKQRATTRTKGARRRKEEEEEEDEEQEEEEQDVDEEEEEEDYRGRSRKNQRGTPHPRTNNSRNTTAATYSTPTTITTTTTTSTYSNGNRSPLMGDDDNDNDNNNYNDNDDNNDNDNSNDANEDDENFVGDSQPPPVTNGRKATTNTTKAATTTATTPTRRAKGRMVVEDDEEAEEAEEDNTTNLVDNRMKKRAHQQRMY